jgi:hypothetical protein
MATGSGGMRTQPDFAMPRILMPASNVAVLDLPQSKTTMGEPGCAG